MGSPVPPWTQVSDEVTLMIFAFLDRHNLIKASLTCRCWHRLAMDQFARWLVHAKAQSPATARLVPRLTWLACPRRDRESLIHRYGALQQANKELRRGFQRAPTPDEFARSPHQVLGIAAVADVVVTLSADGRLRSYNVDSLQLVATSRQGHKTRPRILVRDHADQINVSDTGRFLVSLDQTSVYLWQAPSLELLAVFPHDDPVSARYSSDSRYIATWSDNLAQIWRVPMDHRVVRARKRSSGPHHRRRSRSSNSRAGGKRLQPQRRSSQSHRRRSSSGTRGGSLVHDETQDGVAGHRSPECVVQVYVDEYQDVLDHRAQLPASHTRHLPEDFSTRFIELGFLDRVTNAVLVTRHCVHLCHLATGVISTTMQLPWAHRLSLYHLCCHANHLLITSVAIDATRRRKYIVSLSLGDGKISEKLHSLGPSDALEPGPCSPAWSEAADAPLLSVLTVAPATPIFPVLRPHIHVRVLGGRVEVDKLDAVNSPQELAWWRNQRAFPLLSHTAVMMPDRSLVFLPADHRGATPPENALHLRHFPYSRYPYELVSGQDTLVHATISLPYVFTAGGPNHSLKRWRLKSDRRPIMYVPQFTMPKPPPRVTAILSSPRFPVVASSLFFLIGFLLWQLRLSHAIPPAVPYTAILTPWWLLFAYVFHLAVRNLRTQMQRENRPFSRIFDAYAALLAAFLLFCSSPVLASLKADGLVDTTWLAAALPVSCLFLLVHLAMFGFSIVDLSHNVDSAGYGMVVVGFVVPQFAFLLAFAAANDPPDNPSLMTEEQSFLFLFLAPALALHPWGVAVAVKGFKNLAGYVYDRVLHRPTPLWIVRLGEAWSQPYRIVDDADAFLGAATLFLLPLGSQIMWYQRLFILDDPALQRSWPVILIPVDIVIAIVLTVIVVPEELLGDA